MAATGKSQQSMMRTMNRTEVSFQQQLAITERREQTFPTVVFHVLRQTPGRQRRQNQQDEHGFRRHRYQKKLVLG